MAKKTLKNKNNAFRTALLSFLALILFSNTIFSAAADWKPAVFAALLVPVFILAVLFMLISILHQEQFKQLLHDEAGQFVITIVIAAFLFIGLTPIEEITGATVCGFMAGVSDPAKTYADDQLPFYKTLVYDSNGDPMCDKDADAKYASLTTWAKETNAKQMSSLSKVIANASKFNAEIGYISSRSGFCNMLGVGLGIAGCQAYGVIRGPVGQIITASGLGMLELNTELMLLNFAEKYALNLLLPIGLILRSIHFTRKAGATLIALALSLYLVFPAAILTGQGLCDDFLTFFMKDSSDNYIIDHYKLSRAEFPSLDTDNECDPYEPNEGRLVTMIESFQKRHADDPTINLDASVSDSVIFLVIVRTLLMGAFVLTATITSVRMLAQLFGTEVDVSSIARLS